MKKLRNTDETGVSDLKERITEKYRERTGRDLLGSFDMEPGESYPAGAFDQEDLLDVVCGFFNVGKGTPELQEILEKEFISAPGLVHRSYFRLKLIKLDEKKAKTLFSRRWVSSGMAGVIRYMLVAPGDLLVPVPNNTGNNMILDEYDAEFFMMAYPLRRDEAESEKRRKEYEAKRDRWTKYAESLFQGIAPKDETAVARNEYGEWQEVQEPECAGTVPVAPDECAGEEGQPGKGEGPFNPDDLTDAQAASASGRGKEIEAIKADIYVNPYPGRDEWCEKKSEAEILALMWGSDRSFVPDGWLENLGIRVSRCSALPFYVSLIEYMPEPEGKTYTTSASEAEVRWMKERNDDLEKLRATDPIAALEEGMKLKKMLSRILLEKPDPDGVKTDGEKPVNPGEDGVTDMECPSESAVFEATPENLKAFRDTIEEMYTLYEKKNSDYTANDELGSAFEFTYRLFGLTAPGVRLADKFIRYVALATGKKRMVGNESIEDTLIDMANYCVMTLMEIRKGRKEE